MTIDSEKYAQINVEINNLEKSVNTLENETKNVSETLNIFFKETPPDLKEEVIEGNHFYMDNNGEALEWEHLDNGDLDPLSTTAYGRLGFTFRRGINYYPLATLINDTTLTLDFTDTENLPTSFSYLNTSGIILDNDTILGSTFPNVLGAALDISISKSKCIQGTRFLNKTFFIPNTLLKQLSYNRYAALHFEIDFVLEYWLRGTADYQHAEHINFWSNTSLPGLTNFDFFSNNIGFNFQLSNDNISYYPLEISVSDTVDNSKLYLLDYYTKDISNISPENIIINDTFVQKNIIITLPFIFRKWNNSNVYYPLSYIYKMDKNYNNHRDIFDYLLSFNLDPTKINDYYEAKSNNNSSRFKVYIIHKVSGVLKLPINPNSSLNFSDSDQVLLEPYNYNINNILSPLNTDLNVINVMNVSPILNSGLYLKIQLNLPSFKYGDSTDYYSNLHTMYYSKVYNSLYSLHSKLAKIHVPYVNLYLTDNFPRFNYIVANRGFLVQNAISSSKQEFNWNWQLI